MNFGWQGVDTLVQLLNQAQQVCSTVSVLAPLEARTSTHIGMVFHKLLHMPELASRHYKHALDIGMSIKPVPRGEPWFESLQRRILEVQDRVRSLK